MWFVPPAGRGMGEQREEVEIIKQKILEIWVPCGAGVSESRGGTLWVWGIDLWEWVLAAWCWNLGRSTPRPVLESLRWHHEAGSVNVRTPDFLLLEGIAIDGLMKYCSVMLIKPKSKRFRKQKKGANPLSLSQPSHLPLVSYGQRLTSSQLAKHHCGL